MPPIVVTVTSTVPEPAGAVAVIELSELTVKPVAGVPPNLTAAVPVKPAPLMVTDVPPAAGPDVGEMPETEDGLPMVKSMLDIDDANPKLSLEPTNEKWPWGEL